MRIDVNGDQVDAYRLIMKKENALDILKGRKKVEVRQWSPRYESLFVDKEAVWRNYERDMRNVIEEEIESELRKDVKYIHFTNYNGTWHLDVAIEQLGTFPHSKEGIEVLNSFNFHDWDDAPFRNISEEDEEYDGGESYCIVLGDVVNHHGLK